MEDFYVKELEVVIKNETNIPVYLNKDRTPTGVLLKNGTTFIEGDSFWIISSSNSPLEINFRSTAYGKPVTRWAEYSSGKSILNGVGSACGLTNIRTLDSSGFATVIVNIKGR